VNLRSLEYLVALAEHGNFRLAAEACFVSQPTLSAQIQKLERELGVELIERTTRGATVTPAGEPVVERARTILRDVEELRAAARLHHDPEAGQLRVGVFPTLGPYLLPHVMPTVRERFPRLRLLLVEDKSNDLERQLRTGELDVALLATGIDTGGLHEELLFDEDFVLATPVGHRLARPGQHVETLALAGEHLLLLDEGHCLRDQALSVCALAGAEERSGFRATSLETLRQMVISGTGITLLPRLAVSPPVAVSPDLVLTELDHPTPNRRIAMYWRTSSPFRNVLPRLADAFRSLPDGLVHRLPAS
jgi:LysR family transcriptional regulator, hydrogen peroxide-inducible genes activator